MIAPAHSVAPTPPRRNPNRYKPRSQSIKVFLSPTERDEVERLASLWGVRPGIAAQTLLLRALREEQSG